MGCKSEGWLGYVPHLHEKGIKSCLAQKSSGKGWDLPTVGLCQGPPWIKRFPSLGHFPRLSIFNLVIIPESEETQVPMSLEKSRRGRFIPCSLSWAYTALCHSSASGAWVPALPFRIKSNFPSQQHKGLCNYRSCTHGLGSFGWVEQSQQADGNFGGRHHRESVGVTNPLKPRLKPCWLLKFPILFKQRQHRYPFAGHQHATAIRKTQPCTVSHGRVHNKQQKSPVAEGPSPEFPLSHNAKPAPQMKPEFPVQSLTCLYTLPNVTAMLHV